MTPNICSKDLVSKQKLSRFYARAVDYSQVLAKWESGAYASKAALARHYGIERANVWYILRVARGEREGGLK